jgi:hypothetical protein
MQPVTGHVHRVIHPDDDLDQSAVFIGHRNKNRGFHRDSPYASPFRRPRDGSHREIRDKYRQWLLSQPALVERAKRELTGKTLSCWCAPNQHCHGWTLLEVIGDLAAPCPKEKE